MAIIKILQNNVIEILNEGTKKMSRALREKVNNPELLMYGTLALVSTKLH